jgi:hypothetical protein
MFEGCVLLPSIPALNLQSLTNAYQMLNGCVELLSVPEFSVPNLTSSDGMFISCQKIKSVKFTNVAKLANIRRMFIGCSNLETVDIPTSVVVTSIERTFESCYRLTSIATFSCSPNTGWLWYGGDGNGLYNTFNGCNSLKNIPINFINTETVQDFRNTFYNCHSLIRIPGITVSNATTTSVNPSFLGLSAMVFANNRLSDASQLRGIEQTISFDGANLERPAILDIFNNLVDNTGYVVMSTTQSINIRNNPGTADITPTDALIVSNKNWLLLK